MLQDIFLITGYAGSGKDAAGKVLQKLGYKRYAFADMLKIQCAQKYDFPFELTQTQEGKSTVVVPTTLPAKTVRQVLIEEAALMKELHNDPAYWAKLLAESIKLDQPTKVVITDWRYNAEIEHFQNEFRASPITTLRIQRPSVVQSEDPSEHELDNCPCNYTIVNEGTLEQFEETIMLSFQSPTMV
jgi:hypothetical protein